MNRELTTMEGKEGMALVAVLCFTAVLALLLMVLSHAASSHIKIAKKQADIESAFYVAEAGSERAASYLADGGAAPTSFTGRVGEGVYYTAIVSGNSIGAGWHTAGGQINLNPNNSPQNEFTLLLSDGTVVTRDNLLNGFSGYEGEAIYVHVKPKGSGSQNGLIIDGNTYPLRNSDTYDILAPSMTVNLYCEGQGMGQWRISISTKEAKVFVTP